MRVLHVLGNLDIGGVEVWLSSVLPHFDKDLYQIDFLVHKPEKGALEDKVLSHGCRVFHCSLDGYRHNFARLLESQPPYDVIHSHSHYFSGWVLFLAARANIPMRIAHSHTNTSHVHKSWRRHVYERTMRQFIKRYATVGLAVSDAAATAFYGESWQQDRRWKVLYYGIDLSPFETITSVTMDTIPEDALVIGHIGRMVAVKNHTFIIDVFQNIYHQQPKAYLLLVGDGVERPALEEKVRELGIADRVFFVGTQQNIYSYLAKMDVFVFPSFYEGFGIVAIEAQAAGVPVVMSDNVPKDVILIPELVNVLSLNDGVSEWINAVQIAASQKTHPNDCLIRVKDSPFNIINCARSLENIYHNA
jgi:glycosyltransferase involved in cell wall biosynthesis